MLRSASTTDNQFFGGTTSTDIATYLRHGGFPAKKVTEGTAAFRVEVENLKQAWATCNHGDPVDPRNALSEVVSQASAEWETEYAGQNTQRTIIMRAEADAAAATKAATDNMIEAIGQAWLADQILRWQKYWHDQLAADPDHILKPKQALFDQAKSDLEKARGKVRTLVTTAREQAGLATAAAQRAVTAQQDAWAIADAAEAPRGRGLMYAQQSVQVARASGAAATAAAKATETALNAANATVSTSQTLLALAQTQTHAVKTEFHRIAAQEAAAQAKAAADSADRNAAEAEANLKIAKEAQATAEREEQEAKQAAATAQSKRAVAEMERANAAAARATAESERDKANVAEQAAQEQRGVAATARGSAVAAGQSAFAHLEDSLGAEGRAEAARDTAVKADRAKNAALSRASALEAAAAAAEGSASAGEARQAATDARAAADVAVSAAASAWTAANTATTAAKNARSAATVANGAAERARSASEGAWSAYMTSVGSAAAAHAAAAEAIDASEAAAQNAKDAEADSKKASAAAALAKKEAAAAHTEAVMTAQWAAKTAGYAYATAQAASAARDTATQVIKPANEAIGIGTPYQETDASAAFAVLTGQNALTLSEQQAKAAEAKAVQAAAYSAEAQRLADQAAVDDKLAAEAAAAAAKDAERAAKAAKRAQIAAAEAEKAAKAAQAAAERADGWAMQAGEDAMYASFAANEATSDAVAADSAATEAEKDASSARSAATAASADAAMAEGAATKAEQDATKAEASAANSQEYAEEAETAATHAEEEERREIEAERKAAMENGSTPVTGGSSSWPGMTADEEQILLAECGQQCVDDYRAALQAVGASVIDWVIANGADVLLEFIGVNDLKRCLGQGDVESCLWTLVNVASLVAVVGKLPAVTKAIATVVSGIARFFEKAEWGKRTLNQLRKIIEKVRKDGHKPPHCLVKGATMSIASFSGISDRAAAASDEPEVPCFKGLTRGASFKEHWKSKKDMLGKFLGKTYPKWKDDEGAELLSDLFELITSGKVKYVGMGTLKAGQPAAHVFRGSGLTLIVKPNGEWWTLLQSGAGMDLGIVML
ncbi:hypothetical protein [Streptomyces sp. NPDC088707]|uniref:hypothetical protein n=1 Tax=Streptomyces sp. NPDC088707 TaxID=3365871 RepID=UPI00380AE188